MKVFISWSKSLSQECAELLRDWIKCTLQASKPWMSSQDLDKGTVWFNEISTQLSDTSIGIICLTKENKNNPWILFESGALAKGLTEKRVYTFLIDLKPKDIEPPLSQFNHTLPTEVEMKKLLVSINNQLGDKALEDKILNQVFDMYWPDLDEGLKSAIKNHPISEVEINEERKPDDLLSEILNITRNLDKRIRSVEYNSGSYSKPLGDVPLETQFSSMSLKEKISWFSSLGFDSEQIIEALAKEVPRAEVSRILSQNISTKWGSHKPSTRVETT